MQNFKNNYHTQVASRLSKKESIVSGKAGSIAEEVISAIRTVYAFSGQQKEIDRYQVFLKEARKINTLKGDCYFVVILKTATKARARLCLLHDT